MLLNLQRQSLVEPLNANHADEQTVLIYLDQSSPFCTKNCDQHTLSCPTLSNKLSAKTALEVDAKPAQPREFLETTQFSARR